MTDFTNCPIVPGRAYNGANGNKIAVEYGGGIYMLKFPHQGNESPQTCRTPIAALVNTLQAASSI